MKRIIILVILSIFILPHSLYAATVPPKTTVKPIKILIVPGHDDDVWGAQYGNIKEADMNLVLATNIYNILKKDKRFQVFITRDSLGYTTTFADYFLDQASILAFVKNAKALAAAQAATSGGSPAPVVGAPHAAVSQDVATKLYGLNKWANENNIDAMIHVHFNDYVRQSKWTIGKYKGFNEYFPADTMPNAAESQKLAASIFTQLKKKYPTSTFPPEKGGMTPDQKLIALGSNNTLNPSVRSVLTEYGYIYEKLFRNSTTRHQAYKDMANLTATGIKNYFFPKS
jgi:N-acetylmuramoyl-L-alanine amidase